MSSMYIKNEKSKYESQTLVVSLTANGTSGDGRKGTATLIVQTDPTDLEIDYGGTDSFYGDNYNFDPVLTVYVVDIENVGGTVFPTSLIGQTTNWSYIFDTFKYSYRDVFLNTGPLFHAADENPVTVKWQRNPLYTAVGSTRYGENVIVVSVTADGVDGDGRYGMIEFQLLQEEEYIEIDDEGVSRVLGQVYDLSPIRKVYYVDVQNEGSADTYPESYIGQTRAFGFLFDTVVYSSIPVYLNTGELFHAADENPIVLSWQRKGLYVNNGTDWDRVK